MKKFAYSAIATSLLLVASLNGAHAAEGGGTVLALGAENYGAGMVPPPGTYWLTYATHYEANRVNNATGHDVGGDGFHVTADVIAPRFIWVMPYKLLGGDPLVHVIAPLVSLDVKAGGASQRASGLGDITVGSEIAFHDGNFHSVAGVDVYLPTGKYDKNDLANIGHNHTAVDVVYAASYATDKLALDIKSGYLFNQKNDDTAYTSGQLFHFDYSAGLRVAPGWTAGIGGYYLLQTTSDKSQGTTLDDSKARSLSIGPSVRYDGGQGWLVTLKYEKEVMARNRTQGNALWLKAVLPF